MQAKAKLGWSWSQEQPKPAADKLSLVHPCEFQGSNSLSYHLVLGRVYIGAKLEVRAEVKHWSLHFHMGLTSIFIARLNVITAPAVT